jgi:predicted lipoprotein with Yx(FWY)xxD motif
VRPYVVRVFLALLLALVVAGIAAASIPRRTITVGSSSYGRILLDGRGFALYAFTRDHGRSTCTGACARAWPPFIVARRPLARTGARASLVGVVRRRDGRLQATYAGRPLYYYVGDRKPGQVLCQNVSEYGGLWLVMRASGSLVR